MLLVKRAARLSWITVALLAACCCVLAGLQYRWISDFAAAERARLAGDLAGGLNQVARQVDQFVSTEFSEMIPSRSSVQAFGAEKAYAAAYRNFRAANLPLFRRIALVTRRDHQLEFSNLNLDTGQFAPGDWPAEWPGMRENLEARAEHRPAWYGNLPPLLENHQFDERGERWLLAEVNLDYVRGKILPELLNRYLARSGKLDYDWQLEPQPKVGLESADGMVYLFNGGFGPPRGPDSGRRPGPPPPPNGGMRSRRGGFDRPPPNFERGFENSPWVLELRHRGGSLEAFVAQAKWRNVAASGGLLLLILATVVALVRVTRQSQRLAAAQMDFVAGVSHELRTPLTVIRTAAYNLKRNLPRRPEQVEQYGELIQEQSEKLTALVEQILRFARSEAGHVIGPREPVLIEDLIDASLQFSGEPLERQGITVEKQIAAGLPPLLADPVALKQAFQNLIENAIKYGNGWIGVFVSRDVDAVEIRIADRGPGIPGEEQRRIFDPFFRGSRAVADQIHGTGLGLSLTRKVVEAHGGTIRVHSEPREGTEFIVRLPAAPQEWNHEFAHSPG